MKVKKVKRKKWTQPEWMDRYMEYVTGKENVDEYMNCDGVNCNGVVNAPRALICCQTAAQVSLLHRLFAAQLLNGPQEA